MADPIDPTQPTTPSEQPTTPSETPGRRPGEAAAFLVTIVLLVVIALLGVSLWRTIDDDFQASDTGETAAPPPVSQPADEVVLTVNGTPVRQSEFMAALATVPEQMRSLLATGEGRKVLAEELVRLKLLEQYAKQKGLERDPRVSGQIAVVTANVLANAALRDLAASQQELTPRELYDRNREQFETVRLSQILLPYEGSVSAGEGEAPSEAEARRRAEQLRARIEGGADFAAVAREASADADSASRGGDIGMVGHGAFEPGVEAEIFALPVGGVSSPVKTPYGIHLFKVTEKQTRSFEEVEQALTRSGRQLQVEQAVDALRKEAKVEFSPTFFPEGPGQPAKPE